MSSLSSTMRTRHAMSRPSTACSVTPGVAARSDVTFRSATMAGMAAPRLVLASRSETRLRILRHAGFDPLVVPSDVDETLGDLELSVAVSELALRKASAVAASHHEALVLGCDSLVELDGEVLGKPSSPEEAVAWWHQLRTRSATV